MENICTRICTRMNAQAIVVNNVCVQSYICMNVCAVHVRCKRINFIKAHNHLHNCYCCYGDCINKYIACRIVVVAFITQSHNFCLACAFCFQFPNVLNATISFIYNLNKSLAPARKYNNYQKKKK